MLKAEIIAQMDARLRGLGIPFEQLHVFGVVRLNVHVVCEGRDTAKRWALLLQGVPRAIVRVTRHRWEAKEQQGTNLCPTMREGWLVAVVLPT